jgi:hypothetical protein
MLPVEPQMPETQTSISMDNEIQLLTTEYESLRAEQKLYIEQYSPKFTILGTFVLSAFAFAFQHADYQIIYVVIPLFILLLGYVQIAQVHIISALGLRIRKIEERVRELNRGRPILGWESDIALKLIYPPIIARHNLLPMPNPILMSVLLIIIAMLPLLAYSVLRAVSFLGHFWGTTYLGFILVLVAGASLQAFSFFLVGKSFSKS